MKCEGAYVLTVSEEEAEVIKRFVSAIERATVTIDNDDVREIMEAIAYKSTSANVIGIKIIYEESEKS